MNTFKINKKLYFLLLLMLACGFVLIHDFMGLLSMTSFKEHYLLIISTGIIVYGVFFFLPIIIS